MKVVIVGGGGGVGASVAFNLLLRDEPFDCVLLDVREEMAVSHAMDLEQVVAQGASGSVRVGDDGDYAGADVVVMCAAEPLGLDPSRHVYLRGNAAILRSVSAAMGTAGFDGVLVVVTNPVDPLCTLAVRELGLDRRRVIGYSLNDSLRLRTAIAAGSGIPPAELDAWMIGEHGDASVALFDRVTRWGKRVELDAEARGAARAWVGDWYRRHVSLDSGRSSTWTSGVGVAGMVAALAGPPNGLWPASVVLEGEYGIDAVALSVPVELGPGGVARVHELELAPDEREGLLRAAEVVREAAAALDGADGLSGDA
jgi:malate dehydrogenase